MRYVASSTTTIPAGGSSTHSSLTISCDGIVSYYNGGTLKNDVAGLKATCHDRGFPQATFYIDAIHGAAKDDCFFKDGDNMLGMHWSSDGASDGSWGAVTATRTSTPVC